MSSTHALTATLAAFTPADLGPPDFADEVARAEITAEKTGGRPCEW